MECEETLLQRDAVRIPRWVDCNRTPSSGVRPAPQTEVRVNYCGVTLIVEYPGQLWIHGLIQFNSIQNNNQSILIKIFGASEEQSYSSVLCPVQKPCRKAIV